MKFSHSIQFNAVADWSSQYIAYSNLKKLIYTLEREINQGTQQLHNDGESSPLLSSSRDNPDLVFANALDRELDKIVRFYHTKQQEIFQEVDKLLEDDEAFDIDQEELLIDDPEAQQDRSNRPRAQSRQSNMFRDWGMHRRSGSAQLERVDSDESEDDDDEQRSPLERTKTRDSTGGSRPARNHRRRPTGDDLGEVTGAEQMAATLKKRMISLYVTLCELKSFVQLNQTGFRKVLKKYDKTLDRKLKDTYTESKVKTAKIFQKDTLEAIDQKIASVEQAYAKAYAGGNIELARRELRLDLREHVTWERNTVWREMIGIERKAQAANLGIRRTLLGDRGDEAGDRQGDEDGDGKKEVDIFHGHYRCPSFLFSSTFYTLIGAIIVFILLLNLPINLLPEQKNCLALVIFVSILWATEAIPLFVTSLLVPFLAITLQVVRSDAEPKPRLSVKDATSYVFSAMWTPVIMLLLGGFTIAAALSKHNIAKMMATFVLSKAGTRPRNVLLTSMFVSTFASMWISNVAAPVLCFSIVSPILRNLPQDSDMIKALLLGIALAANIGGAASPIASPQNLIALQNMEPEPSWGTWFFIALPVCILSIFLIWILLLITFKPGRGTTIVPIRQMRDKFTGTQYFITIVTLVTIGLWCVSHQLDEVFGDMGVIAIIPMVLFFGTGILTKEDFNNFLWTIIMLAAGGLALGKSVKSSGLLDTIASGIAETVDHMSLYTVTLVFSLLVLIVATFISHTVAALIILPLVKQVGEGMDEPHPRLLVMASVLMCSAAMGLPTSGFPNMTAIMMEDSQTGRRYLGVKHFITRGVPASVLTWAVVVTVGYGLMRVAGL